MAQPVAPVKKVPIHLQVSVFMSIGSKWLCMYTLYANAIPSRKDNFTFVSFPFNGNVKGWLLFALSTPFWLQWLMANNNMKIA